MSVGSEDKGCDCSVFLVCQPPGKVCQSLVECRQEVHIGLPWLGHLLFPEKIRYLGPRNLDGRNRARVTAESLARVVAAIRITSVRWWSYLPPKHGDWSQRPCVRLSAIRIAHSAFVGSVFVPQCMELRNGLRELIAFAER